MCRTSTQVMDCSGTTPICGNNNTCRKCESHAECGTDSICVFDGVDTGKCATDIAFVNAGSVACSDSLHASTPTSPYCQIQAAASIGGKKFIRVAGSNTAYNGLTLTSSIGTPVDLVIIGPGVTTTPSAMIAQTDQTGITLNPTGGTLSLVIDGLLVVGTASVANPNGIVCNAGAGVGSLTIRRSMLRASAATALSVRDCNLVVTESTLFKSQYGASLNIGAGRTYAITNSFFVANDQIGIELVGAAVGMFAFNTIARNGGLSNIKGAIDCGSDGRVIESSIIANNAHASGGNMSSIAGNCSLVGTIAYTTSGLDPFPGSLNGPAAFESESTTTPNFRLVTSDMTMLNTNKACCIDKIAGTVDGGVATLPTRDVDGNMRPRGAKWDIGAHEAQ